MAGRAKEAAGNELCAAIGDNLGLQGDGWTAKWDLAKGKVNWEKLAKDESISQKTIEKYRAKPSRRLDVRETPAGE